MKVDDLKSFLSRYHIRPDKRLGQNFLLSDEVLDEITAAADLTLQDTVLEIGPGLGFLTRRIAELSGEVVAVEKDRKLCRALHKIFKNRKNVRIICGDALHLTEELTNVRTKEQDRKFIGSSVHPFSGSYKVVANIPYYLTGKILQLFLGGNLKVSATTSQKNVAEAFRPPSLMVLLLQKEVAQRIVAKPGDMSILSVSVQFYADPEIIAIVPKENFYPKPEVDSAIVRITPLSSPLAKGGKRGVRFDVDEGKFFQLVKIGFSNKRKQLQNNLVALPPLSFSGLTRESSSRLARTGLWIPDRVGNDRKTDYKTLLSSLGLNPLCRAQDLSLQDWKKLYDKIFGDI